VAGVVEDRRIGRAAVTGREHHRDVVRGSVEERGIERVNSRLLAGRRVGRVVDEIVLAVAQAHRDDVGQVLVGDHLDGLGYLRPALHADGFRHRRVDEEDVRIGRHRVDGLRVEPVFAGAALDLADRGRVGLVTT
jgi:hypothetical protein